MVTQEAVRRYVLTGSIAAVAATGAWYGAGLKTQQEYKQARRARLEAPPEEQIAQLEATKETLVRKKMQLEQKVAQIRARQQQNKDNNGTG